MTLAPYPEYIATSEKWLRTIPSHWKTLPLYAVAKTKSVSNCVDRELLSVYLNLGVIRFSDVKEKRANATSEDLSKYQAVAPGDFVLNNQQAWRGSVGISKYSGIVSPAYLVLDVRSDLNPGYANFLFRDRKMVDQYLVCSKGVGSIQRNLYWPHLKRVTVAIPPTEEQVHIAKVVKWKTAQINKFIRNKRQFIELLREQRQNVINQAVTRGLDPNVKLKPSGVEWIRDIPEHWEIAPLKHLASINARVLPESTDENYTFKYFDIRSVGTGCLTTEPEMLRFGQAPSRARRILKKGDAILSTVRTYLKAVYYVSDEVEDWIASTGFAALTPKKKIHSPFLGLLIQSDNFINRVIRESIGVAYPAIAETKLGTLHLAYPVSFKEQQKILEHIADSSKEIDQAITRAEREIELMREYRTRLISDVVTGQVDVRGIEVAEVAEEELLMLDDDIGASGDVIDDDPETETEA